MGKVGAEIDVHIGNDVRIALQPRLAQSEPSPLDRQDQGLHRREHVVERAGELARAVGGAVIRDHQTPVVLRLLGEERDGALDAFPAAPPFRCSRG